jgi:hypothetical protein
VIPRVDILDYVQKHDQESHFHNLPRPRIYFLGVKCRPLCIGPALWPGSGLLTRAQAQCTMTGLGKIHDKHSNDVRIADISINMLAFYWH